MNTTPGRRLRQARIRRLPCVLALLATVGCTTRSPVPVETTGSDWRGVDLSYVNELEACGARYRDDHGNTDPYRIFAQAGANVVRLRLWHSPDWTRYGTLDDVKRSARRARDAGLRILLDFHYSDDWVHPGKQLVPAAWRDATTTDDLAERMYDYTYAVLMDLHRNGLLPEAVQIGNEINTDLLITEEVAEDAPVDWPRNAQLLNAGISAARAVSRTVGQPVEVLLHVAQPENVERWFDGALAAGVTDFDLIGISYYPKWSSVPYADLGSAIRRFRHRYGRPVVIVETAYPWTLAANDAANNLLGADSLIEGFDATADGQRRLLVDMMDTVRGAGGLGVVYWEPAWISSACKTRWGDGSHWENAALFDFEGQLLPGAEFLRR